MYFSGFFWWGGGGGGGVKLNAKKKTKQMLIGTAQKLGCAEKTCMSLFLNNVKLA